MVEGFRWAVHRSLRDKNKFLKNFNYFISIIYSKFQTYDGVQQVMKGNIVAIPNYRLGVFGYMSLYDPGKVN